MASPNFHKLANEGLGGYAWKSLAENLLKLANPNFQKLANFGKFFAKYVKLKKTPKSGTFSTAVSLSGQTAYI